MQELLRVPTLSLARNGCATGQGSYVFTSLFIKASVRYDAGPVGLYFAATPVQFACKQVSGVD